MNNIMERDFMAFAFENYVNTLNLNGTLTKNIFRGTHDITGKSVSGYTRVY